MTDVVRDVMRPCPQGALSPEATVLEAAEVMRLEAIGNVLAMADDGRRLVGILTDRDIVVRALAEGQGPDPDRGGVQSGSPEEVCEPLGAAQLARP